MLRGIEAPGQAGVRTLIGEQGKPWGELRRIGLI